MGDADAAMQAYEQALRINQWSIPAMQSISCILRTKEQFPHAVDYLKTILTVDKMNGEVWGNLGMSSIRRSLPFSLLHPCLPNVLRPWDILHLTT